MTARVFVLVLIISLSEKSFAIVGRYLKTNDRGVCEIITKYQDGAVRRCSAVKLSDQTLLSAKHCQEEVIFLSNNVKKEKSIVNCPGEKPKRIIDSELHPTADIGLFFVDGPFDKSTTPFKLHATETEEQKIIQSEMCSAWGYGPDNKGRAGALNGANVYLIPSFKTLLAPNITNSIAHTRKQTLIHRPFKEATNHHRPGATSRTINHYLHPFLYLEARGGFQVLGGDSGGPIFCQDTRGNAFLVGILISDEANRTKHKRDIIAKAVPIWPYSKWIDNASVILYQRNKPKFNLSEKNHKPNKASAKK